MLQIDSDIKKLPRIVKILAERTGEMLGDFLRPAGTYIIQQWGRTTTYWRRRPMFWYKVIVARNAAMLMSGHDSALYEMIDETGTRAHIIRPRGPWPLRFRWGGPGSYIAKTRPNVLSSYPGMQSGQEVRFRQVHHPGFQRRGFTERISTLMPNHFERWFKDAYDKWRAE